MEPGLLDEHGGTERIVVNPATLSFVSGRERLACTRQTRNGAHRWSASCCQSSLGLTTGSHHVPFVALDLRRVQESPERVDEAVGPLRARVNGKFRRGTRRALKADLGSLLGMLLQLFPLTVRWWWANAHRALPFVDEKTLEPVVEVRRLEPPRVLPSTAGCR